VARALGGFHVPFHTTLTRRLGIELPIIQAPMGGANITTASLVSEASAAGALGFVGAAYHAPARIAELAREIRARTDRPFGINLFAPLAPGEARDPSHAIARLVPYHAELGLDAPVIPAGATFTFDEQLDAALESGAPVLGFTFGLLPADAMERAKARGVFVIGTATTVEEATLLERSGVDAIAAQGSEAGAHRGTFARDFESAMVGTIALVPQMVDAVRVPVIASGGIMDGRGIVAALALGAAAAQMGTAFLVTDEAGVSDAYKRAILAATEDATRVTRAFSGRPARGIANRFMDDVERDPSAILPYPLQNALTRAMRAEASRQGRTDMLSLWAGQGVRLARREGAAALVRRLEGEMREAVARLREMGSDSIDGV
jgi:nitronate monooxygenase